MAQQGRSSERSSEALKKVENLDIGALVVSTVTGVVKRRPVSVSMWAGGLLLAAFAKGFSVDDTTREAYSMTLSHAEEVDRNELNQALTRLHRAEEKYYNLKGWFSCDKRCQKALDEVNMGKAEASRVQTKRDSIMQDARREVGIWSVFGVQDVRNNFWASWKSGKDWAARYTMMDAFMLMMPGGKEETLVEMALKLFMQYIVNLTVGLVGAFVFFIYSVGNLVVSYGEPALSGLAFFLLVLVAGSATVGTYLMAIYGTVAGGGLYLVKQAAKQAALNGEQGRRPRQVDYNYGSGRVGGQRSHYD